MKAILSILFSLVLAAAPLYAQNPVAEKEKLLQDLLVFTTTSKSITDIEDRVEQYEKDYRDDLYIYTQVIITKVDIFASYMKSRDIAELLAKLDARWQDYAEANRLTSAEYVMWAALKSSWIRYLSLRQILVQSKLSQQYYQKAIALDKKNAKAYIGLGISAIFTPKVGGGGLKKVVKLLRQGLDLSQYDYDIYNGNLWLSQAYFKLGEEEKYQQAWRRAEAVFGLTSFMQIAKELNQKGKIVGDGS